VTAELPGRRELAELVTDHRLLYEHGDVLTAVVDTDGVPDHLGDDGRPTAPRLDHAPLARGVGCVDLLEEVAVDARTLLKAARHGSLPFPTPHDEATGYLALVARLESLGLLTPGADRRTTARAAAFAAAVRVIDRVHGTSALVGLASHPPLAASLAQHDVLVLGVADAADRSVALAVQLP